MPPDVHSFTPAPTEMSQSLTVMIRLFRWSRSCTVATCSPYGKRQCWCWGCRISVDAWMVDAAPRSMQRDCSRRPDVPILISPMSAGNQSRFTSLRGNFILSFLCTIASTRGKSCNLFVAARLRSLRHTICSILNKRIRILNILHIVCLLSRT